MIKLKKILFENNIINETRNNINVLVRSSTFIEEAFVDTKDYVGKYFKIINKIKTFGGHSTTFVLRKK